MKLEDKIWLTRKCRIEASERLNRYDLISKIILIYYSTFILGISIYGLVFPNSNLSITLTIASLLVLISSLFIASRNFKERSLMFKQCYIKLNQLLHQIKTLKTENDDYKNKLFYDYIEVLHLTENHSQYDYLKVKFFSDGGEDYLKIGWKEKISLFFIIAIRIIFVAFLLSIPIISIICF